MSTYCLVYVTCKNPEEASHIAHHLVEQKLAACANIFSGVTSLYEWQGEIKKESECMMILKTRTNLYSSVEKEILKLHSYDTPAILQLEISNGSKKFLDWIHKQTH